MKGAGEGFKNHEENRGFAGLDRARVHFVTIQNRETHRGRDHVVFDNGVEDGNGEYIYALIPINGDDAPEFRIKQAVNAILRGRR